MRVMLLGLALAGCATAPPLAEGQSIDVLTPSQLERAFEGRVACLVHPDDGGCENLVILESLTGSTKITRTVGATDIEALIGEPMTQVVRQLRMFEQHHDLFRRLEMQRASGAFKYIKEVTLDEAILTADSSRWCLAQGALFEDSQFYFSNNLSHNTAEDEALDEATEEELRSFLRAVIADREFRTIVEDHAREMSALEEVERMFAMLDGVSANCASYSGVVENGRIEIRAMAVEVGGTPMPDLSRAVRPYPADAPPPLRAN